VVGSNFLKRLLRSPLTSDVTFDRIPRMAKRSASSARKSAQPAAPAENYKPLSETKPEGETAEVEKTSFAIPMSPDGTVLIDNMRPKSRDKLAALLRDRSLAKDLGVSDDVAAAGPSSPSLPAPMITALVGALSQLETLLILRVTGAPPDIVHKYAPYTDEEKAQIEPLAGAVLSKYAGPALSKWGDEIALASILTMLTVGKINAISEAMDRQAAISSRVLRRVPVTSPSPDASPMTLDESAGDGSGQ
jgi:hypothetical protein